jgi:hypothetical protein
LLFIHSDARTESNGSREVCRSVALCFLYVVLCVLKVIEAEKYIDR